MAADLVPIVRAAVVGSFVLLAVVAVVRASRHGPSGWWVAAAFAAAATVLVSGRLPDEVGIDLPVWWPTIQLLLIVAFPYLLLRFTASFRDLPRWLEIGAATAGIAVAVATVMLFARPLGDGVRPVWSRAYLGVVLGYWVLVSLVTVVRLWRAGRGQPTVARRRMRSMSAAVAVVAVAMLATQVLADVPLAELMTHTVLLVSAVAFGVGFAPPRILRRSWRHREEEYVQRGTMAVLRADTVEKVAAALLKPTVRIVGAAGAALVGPDGRVVARHGQTPEPGTYLAPETTTADGGGGRAREVVPLGDHGELVVWTSPYTPFFGREEVELLGAMGAVATLALERLALLEAERDQRKVLEEARVEAERAREEAVQADLAKTEFLSRMSHELRTPLNAILGFGQLLEIAELHVDDRESVDHILKAGRHLLALINDVLDLSRIEAGTLTISLEPVHVGHLIADTVPLIRPLADSRSIRIDTAPAECDHYVMTDRQRCRQVLLNLLSNAVKYNRDNGDVAIRCSRVGDHTLRIAVRDTGPGIEPSRQELLFEPFERLDAEKSGVEGTGLGLALTKQLVERLGGTIGVESSPGEGSTFWVDLPITQEPTDTEEAPTRQPTIAESSERTLLLVEDNLANLHLIEAILRRRPAISVIPAMHGQLAIELAHEHRPDVIILDLHLPDLSGREVLHRLRADPRTRDIPVIVASADAAPRRIQQLRQDGAAAYLPKPLDLHDFLDAVDSALSQLPAPD